MTIKLLALLLGLVLLTGCSADPLFQTMQIDKEHCLWIIEYEGGAERIETIKCPVSPEIVSSVSIL